MCYWILNTMRLEIWCRKKIEFNQSLYAGFRSGGSFFFGISLRTKTNWKENSKKKRRGKNRMFFMCIATRHNIQVPNNNREQSKKWILNCFVYRWCLAACVCVYIYRASWSYNFMSTINFFWNELPSNRWTENCFDRKNWIHFDCWLLSMFLNRENKGRKRREYGALFNIWLFRFSF